MARKRSPVKKKDIITIAIVLSIILYIAGVFTGLNANKLIEKKVKVNLDDLKGFIDDSALDLKNIQLQQLFIDNFETDNKCEFLNLYINHQYSLLSSYWNVFPSRLEEYEKVTEISDEYTSLKREYIRFSLRFWLIAQKNYNLCSNSDLIPILYFYIKECEDCIRQGEQFDKFNAEMKLKNKTVIVLPVDANFEDDTVYLLKELYNITSYPFIIVNDIVIHGRVVSSKNLKMILDVS